MVTTILNDDWVLENFIRYPNPPIGGSIPISCLMASLRCARDSTGRDSGTGKLNNSNDPGNWLGAIGYLITLELIGDTLKPSDSNLRFVWMDRKGLPMQPSGITAALDYFSTLSQDEIYVLSALRNSFVHSFALTNRGNSKMTHHFNLHKSSEFEQLISSDFAWDGANENKTDDNATYVNVKTLGDCVEKVYRRIVELHEESKLAIVIAGGAKELFHSYFFAIRTSSSRIKKTD